MNMTVTGERFRLARKKNKVKLSKELIQKFESPDVELTSDELAKMSKRLGVSVTWLLGGGGAPDWVPEYTGSQIVAVREKLKMSRPELASAIGVKETTLHNCELNHQHLGPAASESIKRLTNGTSKLSNGISIEEVVRETLRITSDPAAMKAARNLAKTLEVDSDQLIVGLVEGKFGK